MQIKSCPFHVCRNCLWILGNERILGNSHSVWGAIIRDAKNRGCFFNADNDEDLAESITNVKKELGQFADMLNPDSILFKSSKWKVQFLVVKCISYSY